MQLVNSDTKQIVTLFIKTLSIYAILSVFFYGYIGITEPNGGYYSPFLAKYSIIKFILNGLIYPITWILELMRFDVVANKNNVSIAHEKGILIYHACLGIEIMIGYIALILGYPGRKKLLFLIIGLLFVHTLNIGRMLMILLMIKTNPSIADRAHDVFNLAGYFCILLFYYIWVVKFSQAKNIGNK